MKNVCLVGDKFETYSKSHLNSVVTFSSLIEMIGQKTAHEFLVISVGQGVTDDQIQFLNEFIYKNNLFHEIELVFDSKCKRASKTHTHKHKSENTMISLPVKVTDIIYNSVLMVDERCAEMSDHLTGQHLQGAVLIEAARQMTIAVIEEYFISAEQRSSVGYITNNLNVDFKGYVFPSEVTLKCQIIEQQKYFDTNAKYSMMVEVIQTNEVKATISYQFSVLAKSYLEQKEHDLSQENLDKLFCNVNNRFVIKKEVA